MKTIIMLAAAATTVVGAASVHANAVAPQKSPYHATYDSKRDRYCLTDVKNQPLTGSRIRSTECRSSTEWAQQGIKVERKR